MKRTITIIFVAALVVIGAISVKRISNFNNRKAPETGKEIVERLGIPVETSPVERGSIEARLPIYGMLKGRNEVPIYPKVGGRVLRMLVDNGDRVRAGQVVARLETKEIQDQVNQAQAAVNGARERYLLTQKGARPQERTQVENLVEQARQGFEVAKSNLDRMQKLLASGVISQQQFDVVKLNYDMAKTGYDNAREQLSIVRTGARDEEKNMAEQGLRQAEAALSFVKEQLKNANIISPVSGVVSSVVIDEGTMVGPMMQHAMMTVVDDSQFSLNADISETDLDKTRVGMSAELTIDALPGKKFTGVVEEINPAATMGARTYTLKIRVRGRDGVMRSGMFGRGAVIVEKKEDVMIVPKDAVMGRGGEYRVVVVKGGKAETRDIQLGVINTARAEVVGGLNEGDLVVVVGASGLKSGDKVNAVNRAKAK